MANTSAATAAAANRIAQAMNTVQNPAGSFSTTLEQYRRRSQVVAAEPDEFSEIGTSGLRQYGGFVLEEWASQLQGRKAAWVFREMMDNSAIIGAILFAIEWMARRVTWSVEDDRDGFVEGCMHDMEHSWGDFITDALSFIPYGYSFHESVLKRRQGRQRPLPAIDDPTAATREATEFPASSQFNDGKIGWRRLPVRAQETLLRWEFAGYSTVTAFVQIDWHGGYHIIPTSKGLLFRSRPRRNNPEGYSVLRTSLVPFLRMKNIEQIEAIGVERDLAGIPMMTPPDGVDLFAANNAGLRAEAQKMVTSVRRDEFEGLLMPSAGWEFELVSSGGSRQIDTDAIVRRYEVQIATAMLADFMKLGQNSVGSFALADVKTDMFAAALDGMMDLICETLNTQGVIPLLEVNGMPVDNPPRITHSSATQLDLERVGQFLYQLSGSGAPIPWSNALLSRLFTEAGLPANFEEDVKEPVPVVEGEEPVGPPKLPPGQDAFAREAHYEPTSAQPQQPVQKSVGQDNAAYRQGVSDREHGRPRLSAAQFAASHPGADADDYPLYMAGYAADRDDLELVAKADDEELPEGTVHRIDGKLRDRRDFLANQLEHEIERALADLGELAATAYLGIVHKAEGPKQRKDGTPHLQSLVAAVMRALNLRRWYEDRLVPIFRNHGSRVIGDTQRTIHSEIGLQVGVPHDEAEKIISVAGTTGLGLRDIEPQVRQAILLAIKAGQQAGERPAQIAARIRQQVPAGRFTTAGSAYRSRLIARTESAALQNHAVLAAYRSNPRITHVEVSDGVLADSDDFCRARDGEVVPIDEAGDITLAHPACTLSWNPIVSSSALKPSLPAPELITV